MIKKALLTIFMVLLATVSMPVYSYCDISCKPAGELTSKTSQTMSRITGQNAVAEKIAENMLIKAIKKIVSGEFNVKLESYSVRDLKAGKFKSLKVDGTNIKFEDIYISQINVKTLCDYNYIKDNGKNGVTIMENLPLSIHAVITEDDLNKTMMSPDYQKILSNLNNFGENLNIFKIESANVKIIKNKLFYIMKFKIPFVNKQHYVALSTDLSVKDGRIVFSDTKVLRNMPNLNLNNIINSLNPLDFSLRMPENKNAKVNVNNVTIQDQKIIIDAYLVILKDNISQR